MTLVDADGHIVGMPQEADIALMTAFESRADGITPRRCCATFTGPVQGIRPWSAEDP